MDKGQPKCAARPRCVSLFCLFFGSSNHILTLGVASIKQKLASLESLLLCVCKKLAIDETTIEGYVPVHLERPSPIPSATSSLGRKLAAVVIDGPSAGQSSAKSGQSSAKSGQSSAKSGKPSTKSGQSGHSSKCFMYYNWSSRPNILLRKGKSRWQQGEGAQQVGLWPAVGKSIFVLCCTYNVYVPCLIGMNPHRLYTFIHCVYLGKDDI